jgi:hypothetical protein
MCASPVQNPKCRVLHSTAEPKRPLHFPAACGFTPGFTSEPRSREGPTGNGHDESKLALTPCEADCLVLLAQVQRPLSGVRVHRELDRRNIGIYGLATVKRALAHLKRIQLISNSRTSPRGYYLPESRGLMRQIVSS